MKNKIITIVIRLILIVLGISSLVFQTFHFVFSSLSRNSNDVRSRLFSDTIPHFFTLVICIWFIISQIKSLNSDHK
jgi:hypothetical protein